jgi:two-component system NtrC family response regulator
MSKKIKVLFIDDEPDTCLLFKRMLDKEGFNVFTATSAKDGLTLYKNEKPYIVFLDIVMPSKDGIKILKEIKKIDPKQIVMMITGCGEIGTVRAALKLGAYDYISKPFDLEAIISAIKEALKANPARPDKNLRKQIFYAKNIKKLF